MKYLLRFFAALAIGITSHCAHAADNAPRAVNARPDGTVTSHDFLWMKASTTAGAGFRLLPGVAPTSPNNGDMWVTSAGLYVRINGSTVGPLGTGGGGGGSYTFTESDFNEDGTTISIDYANGQSASGSAKGFLSSTDWSTFNSKLGSSAIGVSVQAFDSDLSTYAGITPSANVQSLLGAANYAAMRSQLGLATVATTGSASDIGSGTLSPDRLASGTGLQVLRRNTGNTALEFATISVGGGDLLAANNLSDLANASTARTNLGLAIGTNVQAFDSDLGTYAAITPSANVQSLLGAANYSAMRTQLTLVPGTDVQAYDVELAALAGLTSAADKGVYFSGSGAAGTYDLISAARTFLGTPTGANLASLVTNETGTGVPAFQSDPLLLYPNSAMGALAIDVTKKANTKSVSADSTFTFSATATAGSTFGLTLTNSDSAAHTMTIPSSFSLGLQATRTSFVMPAGATVEVSWRYDGTTYILAGEPYTLADLTSVTPATGDKVALNDVSAGIDGHATIASILALAPDTWIIPIGDETTAITTGTAKVTFRAPYAATVTAVRASLTTVSSSGTPTFDINEGGTTILSTKLTVDASEKTSTTAASAAVISDTSLADDAEITIDVDTAGTGAAGAKITIYVTRA